MDKNFFLYKEMLDNLYEGVYFVDVNRKISYWNKGAERISGFSADEMVGNFCFNNFLNHVDDDQNQLCLQGCPLHKTIVDGQQREAGIYLHHKNGHRVAVAIRTILIYVDGKVIGAVEVFVDDIDQAEIHKEINQLKTLALNDKLTGLPNRRYLDSYLINRLREFEVLDLPFAILMMDIDHFKQFNDTYGHAVGDQVLQMVAKTFKSAFRKNDMFGRWGGEEFLAVLTGINAQELKIIAEKVCGLVESSVLRKENDSLNVTISIGAALVNSGEGIKSVLERADNALYESKMNGRNRVSVL